MKIAEILFLMYLRFKYISISINTKYKTFYSQKHILLDLTPCYLKTIINFCPTGMIPSKELNSSVPISINEIIEQTHQAYEIGITLVHLHARDSNGIPTYKKHTYAKIIEGIRQYCPGLILCCSTSGRNTPGFEKRSEVIDLQPDMCSLTLSSLNFTNTASINSPETINRLLEKMIDYGVRPELECFDLGMINYGKYLLKKKMIDDKCLWNLIFGNIAGFQAELDQVSSAINYIPSDHYISLGGIGRSQLKVNSLAVAMGYGVRVGLEDNNWFDNNRTVKADNIMLIKRIHQMIEINQKELMTSAELGLYNKKKV